jgi:hypothetical protein
MPEHAKGWSHELHGSNPAFIAGMGKQTGQHAKSARNRAQRNMPLGENISFSSYILRLLGKSDLLMHLKLRGKLLERGKDANGRADHRADDVPGLSARAM